MIKENDIITVDYDDVQGYDFEHFRYDVIIPGTVILIKYNLTYFRAIYLSDNKLMDGIDVEILEEFIGI